MNYHLRFFYPESVNTCILTLLISLGSFSAVGQSSPFTFFKDEGSLEMSNSEYRIKFERYRRKDDTKERMVSYSGADYKLTIQPEKTGKVKTLRNSQDSIIATVFLDGVNRLNILLGDGRILKWNRISTMKSTYQLDGKDIMSYRFKRSGKEAFIEFTDNTISIDALQIICLERGADIFDSSSIGPVIGVAIGLAVVRFIAADR